ncbi:MAG TPA: tryptophan 2,3-dioxygenase family protein [Bacteriovoracaceae bacterium]|nr:tryptophan 2,3-dioxygenase family protein [Bacteriovoracaceae bacterium]
MKIPSSVYYGDYLQLPKLLSAQVTESAKFGQEAHDETLFIITHQTYELWFKQVLHELNSVRTIMQKPYIPATDLSVINARIERVAAIQQILVDQIQIMETMTSLDFMEFRDFLVPASGFQSLQFRLVEATLGIKAQHRMEVEKQFFNSRLKPEDLKKLDETEKMDSIFELVESWLARMPFSKFEDFDFWGTYSKAVTQMLDGDEKIIRGNSSLDDRLRGLELKNLEATRSSFMSLLDSTLYQEQKAQGKVKLSQNAMLSAIFIHLYRDYPALQMPFRILNSLVEVDEKITTWRYRHAIMVQRILGTKIGTGGSSGHEYLKATTDRNRAFVDFFNLATFLIPKSATPKLPAKLAAQLDIVYDSLRS